MALYEEISQPMPPGSSTLIILIAATVIPLLAAIMLFKGKKLRPPVSRPAVKPSPVSGGKKSPEGFLLLAGDALRSRQYAKARDLAQTGLRLNPRDPRTRASLFNIIGNSFTAKKSFKQAFDFFSQAIKTDPSFALPHSNLGALYFMRKEFSKAEKSFKEAIRLNPTHPDPHNNLGILYKNQHKYDLAEKSFAEALRLDSKLQVARENLEQVRKARR